MKPVKTIHIKEGISVVLLKSFEVLEIILLNIWGKKCIGSLLPVLFIIEFSLDHGLGDLTAGPVSPGNTDRHFSVQCLEYF